MKTIEARQRGNIYKFRFPDAENLNTRLHDKIWRHACHQDRGSRMTQWFVDFEEFDPIKDFAWECLNKVVTSRCPYEGVPELVSLWGQLYDKGEYQTKHSHFPCHWSFVYYVNTPIFSSPIIFETTRVRAKSGDFILFPSWMEHRVPKNWCKNRSVVAGNFYYRIR